MLIETLRRAARALHTVFLTIKDSPEEGYYYPHGTDGETTQLAHAHANGKCLRKDFKSWAVSLLISTEEVLRDNGNSQQRSSVNGK